MSQKLLFSEKEKIAIYKVAKMMAEVDGVVLHEEIKSIEEEMPRFGVVDSEYDNLIIAGERIEAIDAFTVIHSMDDKKKKLISAFLGYFISVDNDIDDAELALWAFIVKVCNLPKMNIRQAEEFYKTFKLQKHV